MTKIKMMLTFVAVLAVMVMGAAPAMAGEVQDQRHGSSNSSNHGSSNSSSNNSSSGSSGIVEEQPLKDQGIRQCDIVPPYCQDNTHDSKGPRACLVNSRRW